jgi:HEAT repeat protein
VLLVNALAGALGDPDRSVARAASDALVQISGDDPEVKAVLRNQLQSDEPRRRYGAAFTSARLGPPELRLIPALVEGLQSEHGDVRWSAAKLLVDAGRLHAEVLPIVLGLMRGGTTPAVRRMATYCTRELAPEDPEGAAALLDATRDVDLTVRRAAFSALVVLIDPPAEVALRLIETVQGDPDPATRRIAAVALGHVASWAPPDRQAAVRDVLRAAETSEDPLLARAASSALVHLEAMGL